MADEQGFLEQLHAAVVEAEAKLAVVDLALDDLLTLETRLELLGELWDLMGTVRLAISIVGQGCIDVTPDRFQPYPMPDGRGVFKVRGGKERKRWDGPRLASVVAARLRERQGIAAVVTEDGDTADAAAAFEEVAQTVAKATGGHAASNGWGVTVLKQLGIKPDDYCDSEDAPLSAHIEGR